MQRPDDASRALSVPLSGVHIGPLDGLRGLAILLVLVHHYGRNARGFGLQHQLLTVSEFGWAGVDLFFVLSGFLITGILFDSRDKPGYFRNFYARRALRIFPLYYTALLFAVIVGLLWPQPDEWIQDGAIWIALYMTNFLMAIQGPDSAGPLGFFWSLAVEEHFYLLWPVLVLWMSRHGLMLLAASLVLVSLTLRTVLVLNGSSFEMVYFPTPTRMDGLAIGALIALAARGPGGIAGLSRIAWGAVLATAPVLGYLTLGRVLFIADDPIMMAVGYTLIAIFFGGILVIGINWAPAHAILSNSVLRWFGRYSYGMYVWHPIVNSILFIPSLALMMGVTTPASAAVYLLFSIAVMTLVSLASYYWLEQPFLRLKKHFEVQRTPDGNTTSPPVMGGLGAAAQPKPDIPT